MIHKFIPAAAAALAVLVLASGAHAEGDSAPTLEMFGVDETTCGGDADWRPPECAEFLRAFREWQGQQAGPAVDIAALQAEVRRLGKKPAWRGYPAFQICRKPGNQRLARCAAFLRARKQLMLALATAGPAAPVVAGPTAESTAALAREREEGERLRRELKAARLEKELLVARQGDTDLPLIRAQLPERVEVGDRVRIAGLIGDDGSPPRLKVNGEPVALFRLQPGERPVAAHTLSFAIEVDAAEEGTREYILEACDAAGNCVAERLRLAVHAVNRPSLAARNFALIIGNNDYRDLPDLKTAVADAEALAEVLTSRYAFRPENVKLLLDADHTAILRSLSELRNVLQPDDRLLIYYAGHGQIDPVTEEGFWQPVDAVAGADYTWISNADVRRNLKGMPAKHVLLISDSCFSGSLTRGADGRGDIPKERFYTEIDRPVSRKVISSGGTEPVADSGTGGHSVFAYYLLKALRENDKPYFASFELFNKLARAVTNNSSQKPQYGTVSEAGDEGAGDFTFILKQDG